MISRNNPRGQCLKSFGLAKYPRYPIIEKRMVNEEIVKNTETQTPDKADANPALSRLLNSAPTPLRAGDIVEGNIVARGIASVFVDLGSLGTGIIFGREFYNAQDVLKTLNIGEKLAAKVVDPENEDGYVELSVRDAGRDIAWSRLKELHHNQTTLQVVIKSANRGGLVATVENVPAFLPASQLASEHYPRVEGGDKDKILEELKQLAGQTLDVKILDVHPGEEKLILSERAAELDTLKEELAQFKPGDTIEGVISRIADFGIFMRFGPDEKLEGMVHISEVSWQPVATLAEKFKTGDRIKTKILDIEGGRVALSLKALTPDPWLKIAEKFPKGTASEGTVTKLNPFGAFVELSPGVHGLVHIAEFGSEQAMRDALEIGKKYTLRVAAVEPETHRISLKVWHEREELEEPQKEALTEKSE